MIMVLRNALPAVAPMKIPSHMNVRLDINGMLYNHGKKGLAA